jgi:GNAT superfamily N-acetyltransferase
MEISLLQWIGYLASIAIALSMTMSSILKFRWINLAGALSFSVYGFLIGALPVGFLNAFIALVDIYYLNSIYSKKEVFEILEVRADNRYLLRFLQFHENDMQHFFPGFEYKPELNTVSFFVLRNMAVAGVFLAHRKEDHCLSVGLDFVLPEYRDFKIGKYIYLRLRKRFIDEGFTKVIAEGKSEKYSKYLSKLGFVKNVDGQFEKSLVSKP